MQQIDGVLVSTAVDIETITKQIHENITLGLKNVSESDDFRVNVPIAIVGGGPSLKDTIEELRAFPGPVMACGSVHDYLVSNNVAAKWCILCDPDPLITLYLQKIQFPTKYLVASQCHSNIFKHLWQQQNKIEPLHWDNVYIWHAGGDKFEDSNFGENQTIIGGGCTIGTRAIMMAYAFGYSNIHLFGFDSCLTKDYKHHAYDFETEQESIGDITEIRLGGPDSPIFKVAGYMLGQIFDFKKILEVHASRFQFTIHGDGALKYLMDLAAHEMETK